MRGGGTIWSLMEDIGLLSQFTSLQLSDQQLDSIIAAYGTSARYAAGTDERIAKLLEIRGRVLGGTPMTAADGEAMRGMFQRPGQGQQGQQANQGQEGPSPLGEAIWKLLTEAQQGALLSAGRGMFGPGGGQQWNRQRTLELLTALNQAMEAYQEADWPAKKEALSTAMASAAPEAQRANSKAMFADFLERMWQMPGADFDAKKNDLATTLEALIPQGGSLAPVLALIDPQAAARALEMTFLNAKAQGLLKEIKTARAAKPAG